jgi:hypothetical protein
MGLVALTLICRMLVLERAVAEPPFVSRSGIPLQSSMYTASRGGM